MRRAAGSIIGGFLTASLVAAPPSAKEAKPAKPGESPADPAKRQPEEYETPAWASEARWYYVEVDRFYNADRANDPSSAVAFRDAVPTADSEEDAAPPRPELRSFGGDLEGLHRKLDYLDELEVNALILDPVFHGSAQRPARIENIRHIDDAYGFKGSIASTQVSGMDHAKPQKFSPTDQLFLKFVEQAHKRGFRIVLSGLFGDIGRGVLPEQASPEKILKVTRRWMDPDGNGDPSDGVDGWFVTMPANVPADFWPKWRKEVKSINADALLILMDVTVGTRNPAREHFDVAVNTEAAMAIRNFFRPGPSQDPQRLFERLAELNEDTTKNDLDSLNLLSMAAGPRFVTLLSVPGRSLEASKFPAARAPTDEDLDRWRLATIFQHFYPGAPVTYYGDEVGMYGLCRPFERPPMWWTEHLPLAFRVDHYRGDLYAVVRWLHEQRERYAPLRSGDFRPIDLDNGEDVLAFSRKLPGEEFILLINYGKKKQKIMLKVGEPMQMVGLLSPNLEPTAPKVRVPRAKSNEESKEPPEPRPDYSRIRRIRTGGSRQFVNDAGRIAVWLSPMSARVVLVSDAEPWRRK